MGSINGATRSTRRTRFMFFGVLASIALAVVGLSIVGVIATTNEASATSYDPNAFVLTLSGDDADCFISWVATELPFTGTYSIDVDWGDGSAQHFDTGSMPLHYYTENTARTISVTGTASAFGDPGGFYPNSGCIRTLEQWGTLGLTNLAGAFRNATSLTSVPSTLPTGVTDLHNMFDHAVSFNGDIRDWNTTSVTNFSEMFLGASNFDQPLGSWVTSNATDLSSMFRDATSFNQVLNSWNVNSVWSFARMFEGATSFNQTLSRWSGSSANTFAAMFRGATSFNSYFSAVMWTPATDVSWMYAGATLFNKPVDLWIYCPWTIDMSHMFDGATSFNSRITGCTDGATDVSFMFQDATSFNTDIDNLQFPWAYTAQGMFKGATSFNARAPFQFQRVDNAASMFEGTTAMTDPWPLWNRLRMESPTDTSYMFHDAPNFDSNLIDLGMLEVVNAKGMFENASSFRGTSTSDWRLYSLQDATDMFHGASSFDTNTTYWWCGVLQNATSMFRDAVSFGRTNDPGVQYWTVGNLHEANQMFAGARSFNAPLGLWDITGLLSTSGISFDGSGWSSANYATTLMAWSGLTFTNTPTISVGNVEYPTGFTGYHDILTSAGVTIYDGGPMGVTAGDAISIIYDFEFAGFDGRRDLYGGMMPVTLPITGGVGVTVDWGDGSNPELWGDGVTPTHTYDTYARSSLQYDVSVYGAVSGIDGRQCNDPSLSCLDILAIPAIGDVGLVSLDHAFTGMNNITQTPAMIPSTVRTIAGLAHGTAVTYVGAFDTLSTWDTSNVMDMSYAFSGVVWTSWPTLGSWNVGNVVAMDSMFAGSNFNASIAGWTTSNLRSMTSMFDGAMLFNQQVNLLDVSHITDLNYVFRNAYSFDQDLSGWNTRNVRTMVSTFDGAWNFTRPLTAWNIGHLVDASHMLDGVGYSMAAYDALLASMASQTTQWSVMFGAWSLHYSPTGAFDRRTLTERGWGFVDDVLDTAGQQALELVFDPATSGCNNSYLQLAMSDNGGIDVDWGDPDAPGSTHYGQWEEPAHSYSSTSAHTVRVTGSLNRWGGSSYGTPGGTCITSVNSFGELGITSLEGAFAALNNLTHAPSTLPTTVRSLKAMFATTQATFTADVSGWDTSRVTDMSWLLWHSRSNPSIGSWNTSNVTSLIRTFNEAYGFNGPIGNWNVGRVTNMSEMFWNATAFDQDISGWDTHSVTDMRNMFQGATVFNHPIGSWNTSNLSFVEGMFNGATAFDQSLAGWDVRNISNMFMMFTGATSFNGDVTTWDMSNVTMTNSMFNGASSFNQPIGSWNVSSVYDANSMFASATSFNQDLDHWRFNSLGGAEAIFYGATAFNGDVSGWRFPSTTNLNHLFEGATSFNRDLSTWDVSTVTQTFAMFYGATSFNQDLSAWNTTNLVNGTAMFQNATSFDQPIANWEWNSFLWGGDMFSWSGLSARHWSDAIQAWHTKVAAGEMTNGAQMGAWEVRHLPSVDADLSALREAGWNIWDSGVIDVTPMTISWNPTATSCGTSAVEFALTGVADGTVDWGDGSVEPINGVGLIRHTYADASPATISLAGDIHGFGDGQVHAGRDCITGIPTFGGLRLSSLRGAFRGWSNLTVVPTSSNVAIFDLSNTFRDATSFNQNFSWGTQSATTTSHMFDGATLFNQDIGGWGLGSVVDASYMFAGATSFNRAPSNWGMQSATNMSHMFAGATSFNSANSKWGMWNWNVSRVVDASHMFDGAISFNQALTNWNPIALTDATGMFDHSGLNSLRYSSTLVAWAARGLKSNVPFGAAGIGYLPSAVTSRDHLVNDLHWTITDGGAAVMSPMIIDLDTTKLQWNGGVSIGLPILEDVTIDWGDGSSDHITTGMVKYHNYANYGMSGSTYTIRITGFASNFSMLNSQGREAITGVRSFGNLGLTDLYGAFYGLSNLTTVPATLPTGVTNLRSIFGEARSFNGDLSGWDVSRVTDMSNAFNSATAFNGDLSGWDVSHVTNMTAMFRAATAFNADVSGWNVSAVGRDNFAYMFRDARSFNRPLGAWDLSHARFMTDFLTNSGMRSRTYSESLNAWASNQATASNVDFGADGIHYDDRGASAHLQLLNSKGWYFHDAGLRTSVPMTLTWNPAKCASKIADLSFQGYTDATIDWGDSSGVDSASLPGTVSHSYASDATLATISIEGEFDGFGSAAPLSNVDCYTSVAQWGNTGFTSLSGAFWGWDSLVSLPERLDWYVTDFSNTFNGATNFNQYVDWPTNYATTVAHMFDGATSYNQNFPRNLERVTDASYLFRGATSINQTFDSMNTANLVNASHMFDGATSFAGTTYNWDLASLRDGSYMFRGAGNYPGAGNAWWNVRPENTSHMFDGAASFNTVLSNWSMTRLVDASHMLDGSGIAPYNYSSALVAWAADTGTAHDVTFGASGVHFRPSAQAAHANLAEIGWVLLDGGFAGTTPMRLTFDTSLCDGNVTLPLVGVYSVDVDWGDGSSAPVTSDSPNHQYGQGIQHVTVVGDVARFGSDNWQGVNCLTSVDSWGDLGQTSLRSAFSGAYAGNLTSIASDLPASVTDMNSMFRDTVFNVDLGAWDVSHVRNMGDMFHSANTFNRAIGGWDVSNVTSMEDMFRGAETFNQPIGSWDTRSLRDISYMFSGTPAFNQPIGAWDVSDVWDMSGVFEGNHVFTQSLNSWDVSGATTMSYMFSSGDFNGDLSAWRPISLLDASNMFRAARNFDQPLNSWPVSSVRNMSQMFVDAHAFDQPLDQWQTTSLLDASYMFAYSDVFDSSVDGLIGPSATNIVAIFAGAESFNQPLNTWDVSNVEQMQDAFSWTGQFNQDLSSWNTINVRSMARMFRGAHAFDQSLASFKFDHVTDAWEMVGSSVSMANYTASLRGWGERGENAHYLPISVDQRYRATATESRDRLVNWGWSLFDNGLYAPTPMRMTFNTSYCTSPTIALPISHLTESTNVDWGDGNAADYSDASGLTHTFASNGTYQVSITGGFDSIGWSGWTGRDCVVSLDAWGETGITAIGGLFAAAPHIVSLPADFPSSVTSLDQTFSWTTTLNADISGWDVHRVVQFTDAFQGAEMAHLDVHNWDVSSALRLDRMFGGATNFNQDVTGWNVSNVESATGMFEDTNLDRSLGSWTLRSGANLGTRFASNMSKDNWTATLQGWANNGQTGNGVTIDVGSTKYARAAQTARAALVTKGWTITDGGLSQVRPNTPVAPTATLTAGGGGATINWTLPFDGDSAITGSAVTVYSGQSVAKTCVGATASATSCAVTGLTNGTAYTAKVVVTNAIGSSDASPASSPFTPIAVPGAPTNVTTERGNGIARVNWKAPTSNGGATITSYKVVAFNQAGSAALTPEKSCTVSSTAPATPAPTCVVTGLPTTGTFTFKVKAQNSVGWSVLSATSATAVMGLVPSIVDATKITVLRDDKNVKVTWALATGPSGKPVTGYTVVVLKPDGTAVTGLACPAGGATTTTVTCTGLTNSVAYVVKVRASNSIGAAPWSDAKSLPTGAAPTAPRTITATTPSAAALKVSWLAPQTTGGFLIRYKVDIKLNGTLVKTVDNLTDLTTTVTGLQSGKTYTIVVTAKNALGSAVAQAITKKTT